MGGRGATLVDVGIDVGFWHEALVPLPSNHVR